MLLDLAWRLSRPLWFRVDPERAHRFVLGVLARSGSVGPALLRRLAGPPDPSLATSLGPLRLAGPIGLAAGLDKDGEAIRCWEALGFGFVEVGTVTALPQPGNPRPRLFRLLPERGLINRMGFNNLGSEALASKLRTLRQHGHWPRIPVGANVGKSKVTPLDEAAADYRLSIERLRGLVDWITVNVSSPNTPGLRALQRGGWLGRLLDECVAAANGTPVMVKLSPDLGGAPAEGHESSDRLASAVETAIRAGCSGIIATNTTRSRPGTTGRLGQEGGLSGAPLWPLARQRIDEVLRAARGRIPVVGVGGIATAEQVRELIGAGCAAVQIYSALMFEGPGLVGRLNRELAQTSSR